jgi:hypothetical protein
MEKLMLELKNSFDQEKNIDIIVYIYIYIYIIQYDMV